MVTGYSNKFKKSDDQYWPMLEYICIILYSTVVHGQLFIYSIKWLIRRKLDHRPYPKVTIGVFFSHGLLTCLGNSHAITVILLLYRNNTNF